MNELKKADEIVKRLRSDYAPDIHVMDDKLAALSGVVRVTKGANNGK